MPMKASLFPICGNAGNGTHCGTIRDFRIVSPGRSRKLLTNDEHSVFESFDSSSKRVFTSPITRRDLFDAFVSQPDKRKAEAQRAARGGAARPTKIMMPSPPGLEVTSMS